MQENDNGESGRKKRSIEPKKLLFGLWMAFSTISAATSLASLADGILAWSPFVQDLIASYRRVTNFVWGGLFSLFSYEASQSVKDYLTINSLLAISITWAFYNTGRQLGFSLSSMLEFVKNNLLNMKMGGNFFENFEKHAREDLRAKLNLNEVPEASTIAIDLATRDYPKVFMLLDGLLSSLFLVIAYFLSSYLVPFFVRWRDMRWSEKLIILMNDRRAELQGAGITEIEKTVLLESFDNFCVSSAIHDREILKLFHRIFWQSILWYLLAVLILFLVMLVCDYLYLKLL